MKTDITEFTTNFQVLLLGFYFGIKSSDSPLASLTGNAPEATQGVLHLVKKIQLVSDMTSVPLSRFKL